MKTSTFQANNGTAWTKEVNTLDEAMSYDANGNILTLTRKQNQRALSGTTVTSTAQLIDNLTYTYATGAGNRLTKVEDAVAATIGVGDFKNGSTATTEYTYNNDGSELTDLNKGISGITYNVLGKPQQITYSNGNKVVYTYNAAGRKLRMVSTVINGSTTITTTDYVGSFVYTNNTLSFFSSPEGRVANNGGTLEYQYAITDHQGNTRVLFTSAAPPVATLTATFEGNAGDNSNLFGGVSTIVPYGSANITAGGSKVLRMNQTVSVAATKSLRVFAGDKIDLETYCYYEGSSGFGSSNISMASLINTVAGAFGGVSGGAGEAGKIYNGVNSGISNWGYGANQGDSQPSAYLNYILFDQQYRVMTMGWTGVPSTANFAKQKISLNNLNVKEAGYLFVYLSYETASNNWVYFDDLKVTHTKTQVIQYNEYYAHGLQTANSWTRENAVSNNFLANGGTELNKTTGFYDLEFRNFDPVLGRMTQMDPMSDKYSSLTPYNYSFNNPILFSDRNGADPLSSWDEVWRIISVLWNTTSGSGEGGASSWSSTNGFSGAITFGSREEAESWAGAFKQQQESGGENGGRIVEGQSWTGDKWITKSNWRSARILSKLVKTYSFIPNGKGAKKSLLGDLKLEDAKAGARTYILGGADVLLQGPSSTTLAIKDATNGTLYNVEWTNYKYLPQKVADDIIANYTAGQKVKIYGYSKGGELALEVSRRLKSANIPISMLVTIDAADGPLSNFIDRTVPSNVSANFNFFQTTPSGIFSRGDYNSGSGLIFNYNLTSPSINHGNIDEATMNIAVFLLNH